jgi:hypothetical protein
MSKRVYLPKNPCQTTQEEKTPVSIRIQARNATVKAWQTRRQDAYRRDAVRLVRRTSVLLALAHPDGPRAGARRALGAEPGLSLGLAAGVPVAWPGQPALWAPRWAPREVDAQPEQARGGVAGGRPPGGGLGDGLVARGREPRAALAGVRRPLESP